VLDKPKDGGGTRKAGFTVRSDELRKVPYLAPQSHNPQLAPMWDGTRWSLWIPHSDGRLLEMHPVEMGMGLYVAKAPARENDLHLPFLEFLWKRAAGPDIWYWSQATEDDLHNMATSLAKIDHFFECSVSGRPLEAAEFVTTELEYIAVVCRSMFDHLQETVARLWERITLLDGKAHARKRHLPKTFSDMVLREGAVLDAAALADRRGIPDALAAVYARAGDFFSALRNYRDAIVHGGRSAPHVYRVDRGFAVGQDARPFCDFPIWKEEHLIGERLVSLRPALAHLVCGTLYTLNDFSSVLGASIEFPVCVLPEYGAFIRTVHADALLRTQAVLRGGPAWWRTEDGHRS
jgi:hypothetical protein